MTVNPFEILLAKLFGDPQELALFLRDRESYARQCGLTAAQFGEVLKIDAASLQFAVRSYERKRRRDKAPCK
jgi:hypothetical protein